MRAIVLTSLVLLFSLVAACAGQTTAAETGAPQTEAEKISYAIGANLAASISADDLVIDFDMLKKGIEEGYAGASSMDQQEVMKTLSGFQQKVQARMNEAAAAKYDVNKAEGDAFHQTNASAEGVVTLDSGLQYQVINSGDGATPTATSTVTVHYTGKLLDGTVFDSSVERGQPATFPVNGVIGGWTEALQLMKEGDKWMLFIPEALAYGRNGAPPRIPPGASLTFEVELIKVE